MFNKKIPAYLAFMLAIVCSAASYFITRRNDDGNDHDQHDESIAMCKNSKVRLGGYKFIRPLLFTETTCESANMIPVKSAVMDMLQNYRMSGTIMNGSVYLRELDQGDWVSIEENDLYLPGSLMKVPELITFMKMKEKDPGLLDRKIFYKEPRVTSKSVHYIGKSIEPGKYYSVRELLYYMIVYSDNNATVLLNEIMDIPMFQKVFTDLGIPKPDINAKDIPISAIHFSRFMRAIYNASYLNIDDSEYCAELLAASEFPNGMRSGVPSNVALAHKFGEAGDANAAHFSESGIIYINKAPYLLTIMTKGRDLKLLPDVVKNITGRVYEMLNA